MKRTVFLALLALFVGCTSERALDEFPATDASSSEPTTEADGGVTPQHDGTPDPRADGRLLVDGGPLFDQGGDQPCNPNGTREGTEQCDYGDLNSWLPDAPCRPDCTLPRCGDKVIDSGEQCDDATVPGDRGALCKPSCELAFPAPLAAIPPMLNFGTLGRGCDPQAQIEVELLNVSGALSVEVSQVVAAGCTAEVQLPAGGVAGTIPAGGSLSFTVTFKPQQFGIKSCALRVISSTDSELRIPVTGQVVAQGTHTDRFLQRLNRKVDVLFALDPSGSMTDERARLIATAQTFFAAASAAQLDFHLASVSILPDTGAQRPSGVLFGDPPYIDNQTPDLLSEFEQRMTLDEGEPVEQGFDAIIAALSPPLTATIDGGSCGACAAPNRCVAGGCRGANWGFRRPDASLEILTFTDEDDTESSHALGELVGFLNNQVNPLNGQFVRVHGLLPGASCAGPNTYDNWEKAIEQTGGLRHDLCSSDYRPAVEAITDRLFGLQDRFPLSRPARGDTIAVTVDGQAVSFVFDAQSGGVVLDPPPADGAVIEVSYTPICTYP